MSDSVSTKQQRALEAAQGYLTLELPDAALRELRSFVAEVETPVACWQLRAEAHRANGHWDDSLNCFERALPHVERPVDVLMGMAWCFKRTGRLDKAIDAMRQAYQASPKQAIVLYNLACYFSLAGEKEESLSWLGRALRLDRSLRKLIPDETDFNPIRNDLDFQYLLQLAESKEQPSS